MVERVRSTLGRDGKRRGRRGGYRANGGRRLGSENEAKRVARAQAALTGMLPHEMLLDWARTGRMYYPGTRKTRQLEPSERISCARACANFYRAPYQPTTAPGEQPPIVRVELDEKVLAKLSPESLGLLRDELRALQAEGVGDMRLVPSSGAADPARYGRMLSESSETAGRA
ncbi:hypothetical protein K8I85_07065 [bacterium]|nr:hypothetical protein [bacterium]